MVFIFIGRGIKNNDFFSLSDSKVMQIVQGITEEAFDFIIYFNIEKSAIMMKRSQKIEKILNIRIFLKVKKLLKARKKLQDLLTLENLAHRLLPLQILSKMTFIFLL